MDELFSSLEFIGSAVTDVASNVEIDVEAIQEGIKNAFDDEESGSSQFDGVRSFLGENLPESTLNQISKHPYALMNVVSIDADRLLAADDDGLSDPYLTFQVVKTCGLNPKPTDFAHASEERKTEVIEKQVRDLHWENPKIFYELRRQDVFECWLHVQAFDEDSYSDDFLGEAFFPLRLIFLRGSTTSSIGKAGEPHSFTLPLSMPRARRPGGIDKEIDTDSPGSCGTVTLHITTQCPSFLGDAISTMAAQFASELTMSGATATANGFMRHPSDESAAFDTLLFAIHSNTLPNYLATRGSCTSLQTGLLSCLALRDRAADHDFSEVHAYKGPAQIGQSAAEVAASALYNPSAVGGLHPVSAVENDPPSFPTTISTSQSTTLQAPGAISQDALPPSTTTLFRNDSIGQKAAASLTLEPSSAAPQIASSILIQPAVALNPPLLNPAVAAVTSGTTMVTPTPVPNKNVDWFAYDALDDHEVLEEAPLPPTIDQLIKSDSLGATLSGGLNAPSALNAPQASSALSPLASTSGPATISSSMPTLAAPAAATVDSTVKGPVLQPVSNALPPTTNSSNTGLFAPSTSAIPLPGASSPEAEEDSKEDSGFFSSIFGSSSSKSSSTKRRPRRAAPSPSTMRAWQVCWMMYQKRILHAMTNTSLPTAVKANFNIQIELSRMLHSPEFVSAVFDLIFYDADEKFKFSPVFVLDYLYSMLRLDEPAYCNQHLLKEIASQAGAFVNRLFEILLDEPNSGNQRRKKLVAEGKVPAEMISLTERAYGVIPWLGFCFKQGMHVKLSDELMAFFNKHFKVVPKNFVPEASTTPIPSTIDLKQITVPFDIQNLYQLACAMILANPKIQPALFAVLQSDEAGAFSVHHLISILCDPLLCEHRSIAQRQALADFLYQFRRSPPSWMSQHRKAVTSAGTSDSSAVNILDALSAIVFKYEYRLQRLPVQVEWASFPVAWLACSVEEEKLEQKSESASKITAESGLSSLPPSIEQAKAEADGGLHAPAAASASTSDSTAATAASAAVSSDSSAAAATDSATSPSSTESSSKSAPPPEDDARLSLRNAEYSSADCNKKSSRFSLITTPWNQFENVDIGFVIPHDDASSSSLAAPRALYVTHVAIDLPARSSPLYDARLRSFALYASMRSIRGDPEFEQQNEGRKWSDFKEYAQQPSNFSMPDLQPVLVVDIEDKLHIEKALPQPTLASHLTLKLNPGGFYSSKTRIAMKSIKFFGYFEDSSASSSSSESTLDSRFPHTSMPDLLGDDPLAKLFK